MLQFDSTDRNWVAAILERMHAGDYDAARKLLAEAPDDLREDIRMTIAARTAVLL